MELVNQKFVGLDTKLLDVECKVSDTKIENIHHDHLSTLLRWSITYRIVLLNVSSILVEFWQQHLGRNENNTE